MPPEPGHQLVIFLLRDIPVVAVIPESILIFIEHLCLYRRKDLISPRFSVDVEADDRMFLPVIGLFVGIQCPEHGSVFHIVAVNDQALRIHAGGLPEKRSSTRRMGAVKGPPKIILRIRLPVHHRVIDPCIRNSDPADVIRILILKCRVSGSLL